MVVDDVEVEDSLARLVERGTHNHMEGQVPKKPQIPQGGGTDKGRITVPTRVELRHG